MSLDKLHRKNLSDITAQGAPWTGLPLPPGTKMNRDHLIKDNVGYNCPKTFATTKETKERWCRQE